MRPRDPTSIRHDGNAPAKAGTYLSVTVTINARSREQLDALYKDLSGHPMVMMVL